MERSVVLELMKYSILGTSDLAIVLGIGDTGVNETNIAPQGARS